VVDQWQQQYSRDELVLVDYDQPDPFFSARYSYYSCIGVPTICGDGLSDVWPCTENTLTADYNAHNALESPATIELNENAMGDFTAHIVAEETIEDAFFVMVAVEDDSVPAAGGEISHLPYHARVFMTAVLGDPFSLAVGESIDITKTFEIEPSWDYSKMGVVCWIQKDGGVNPSPSPNIPSRHQVLQAAYVGASIEISLAGSLELGEILLSWEPIPGTNAYWIYGAGDDSYFEPGFAPDYEHRLAILRPGITTWSSSNGVGNPDSNWTYLVIAVDTSLEEFARSNRVGEFDAGMDIP
jgi:hypothetical protein